VWDEGRGCPLPRDVVPVKPSASAVSERITDTRQLDEKAIAAFVAAGREVVIQFSKPIYTPELLAQIDTLAQRFGDNLQVRFYGHYGNQFDFTTLGHVPSVRNLAVDCLEKVTNPEALHHLEHLRALSIGVNDILPSDLLDSPAFAGLQKLILAESRTAALNLRPLRKMKQLSELHLSGYSSGIEMLSDLPLLKRLSLSGMKRGVRLDFISRITSLCSLRLILGGREDITEVTHPELLSLEIIRVQGFCRFTPSAFPRLRELRIEDQIKLSSLEFSTPGAPLERFHVFNCKGLDSLTGLRSLSHLSELRISRTAIDCQQLIALGLPADLRIFGFYTGSVRKNREIRGQLDKLGYKE
jgi:protein phosphatase 1 regulatory subunit 7